MVGPTLLMGPYYSMVEPYLIYVPQIHMRIGFTGCGCTNSEAPTIL